MYRCDIISWLVRLPTFEPRVFDPRATFEPGPKGLREPKATFEPRVFELRATFEPGPKGLREPKATFEPRVIEPRATFEYALLALARGLCLARRLYTSYKV